MGILRLGWNGDREDVPFVPGTLLHRLGPERVTPSTKEVQQSFENLIGGGGIRTHGSGISGEGETRSGDYKSPALNRSATPPQDAGAEAPAVDLAFRLACPWADRECFQPIIGSVDHTSIAERNVRGKSADVVVGGTRFGRDDTSCHDWLSKWGPALRSLADRGRFLPAMALIAPWSGGA